LQQDPPQQAEPKLELPVEEVAVPVAAAAPPEPLVEVTTANEPAGAAPEIPPSEAPAVAATESNPDQPREPLLLAPAAQAIALLAPPPIPAPEPQEDTRTESIAVAPVPETAAPEAAPVIPAPEPAAPQPPVALSVESIKPAPTAPPAHQPNAPLALDPAGSTAELPAAERPPSGSWLQLAGLQDYQAAARGAMQPAVPPSKILMPDSGPRITLPGPTLPPELNSLQEANVTVLPAHAARETRRLPGWAVSLLFVIGIPALGAAVLFYFMPLGRSNAETKPTPQEPQTTIVQAASHPLAQYIEVTGFRFIVDFNKKSEIHYLVVNHSAAELADMTVYVTLRTADAKAGQPPVCRFSFRAPTLGAFESKEMTSPIEKLSRPVALPEWQDLRPEVQIAQ
jgi:hypothetical protein